MDNLQNQALEVIEAILKRNQPHTGHDDLLLLVPSLANYIEDHDTLKEYFVEFQHRNSKSGGDFETEIHNLININNPKGEFDLRAVFTVFKRVGWDVLSEEKHILLLLQDEEIESDNTPKSPQELYQKAKEDLEFNIEFPESWQSSMEKELNAKHNGNNVPAPYAERKGIEYPAGSAFSNGDTVYIPMQPLAPGNDKTACYQYITSKQVDQNKWMPTGSQVSGSVHFLPNKQSVMEAETVLECEGWATGEILHRATDLPVICVMNKCNYILTGISLIEHGKAKKIVICVDVDDAEKRQETVKILQAGIGEREIFIGLAIPEGSEKSNGDFWDVSNQSGDETVNEQILLAIQALKKPEFVIQPETPLDIENHTGELDLLKHLDKTRLTFQLANTIANATQMPKSTVLVVTLGVFSSMASRVFAVQYIGGKSIPIGLYGLAEQPSGAAKSWVVNTSQTPFINAFDKFHTELKSAYASLDPKDKEGKAQLDELFKIRLFETNATPESLENVLHGNNGHFSAVSSEQGLCDTLLGTAYKDGTTKTNNDLLLSGFNGDYMASSRISRQGYNGYVAGGMTCFAQEGTIDTVLSQSNGTGLAERFLLIREPHNLGKRDFTQHKQMSFPILEWYRNICGILTPALFHNLKAFRDLPKLFINRDGWQLINEYRNKIEPELLDSGRFSHSSLRGAAGKADIQIMKIAANLHLLNLNGTETLENLPSEVSTDLVFSAIGIFDDLLEMHFNLLQDKGVMGERAEWEAVVIYLSKRSSGATLAEMKMAMKNLRPFKGLPSGKAKAIEMTVQAMETAKKLKIISGKYFLK